MSRSVNEMQVQRLAACGSLCRGLPPPLPHSLHQPGILSGTRASSEATFSDANFRIDF